MSYSKLNCESWYGSRPNSEFDRHDTPDTACLIRAVPYSIIFGHDMARHEKNKIIKDTVRKHGVPEHDTIRHGTNLEHYRWHVISGRSHLNP
jgi:hypothetical protein